MKHALALVSLAFALAVAAPAPAQAWPSSVVPTTSRSALAPRMDASTSYASDRQGIERFLSRVTGPSRVRAHRVLRQGVNSFGLSHVSTACAAADVVSAPWNRQIMVARGETPTASLSTLSFINLTKIPQGQ